FTALLPPPILLFRYTTLFRSVQYHDVLEVLHHLQVEVAPTLLERVELLAQVVGRHVPDLDELTPHSLIAGLQPGQVLPGLVGDLDRKSTRLNSSHQTISYAVF